MDTLKERLGELLRNRLFVLLAAAAVIFMILVGRLFFMQIVNGEEADASLTSSVTREVTIPAARGNIYDRYGRPLAVNEAAFSVEIDDSITVDYEDADAEAVSLYKKLIKNGYVVGDDLPITKDAPYEFTISSDELEEWKTNIGLTKKQMNYTAEETLNYLYERFGITDADMTEEEKRALVSLGININDKNIMITNLIMTIETNGGEIVDELPISQEQPYYFLLEDEDEILSWKSSVSMSEEELDYDAEESMQYLIELFGIPENISPSMQRKVAAVRYSLYLQRYKKYQPVTVAREINDEVIATVEENLETVKEVWQPLLQLAEELDVKIAIENCPMLFGPDQWPGGQNLMTTPAIWRKVFKILPSDHLGINYDPSHFVWQMVDYIRPLYEFRSRIFHVHYKDIKLYPEKLRDVGVMAYPLDFMSPKLPGLGDVDWGRYVSALTDIGYDGFTCIEVEDKAFEGSREKVLESLRLSKHYIEQFVI